MTDYLSAFLSLFLNDENQLWLMFASAFLSATVLPGNSEILFSTLLTQAQVGTNQPLALFALATLGNSLGSFSTYLIARLLPPPNLPLQRKIGRWAISVSQKYGVWALWLSWLPIVGDLLCGIAGWLRFNSGLSLLFITLGKATRYAVLWWSIATFFH